jgi:DNA primase
MLRQHAVVDTVIVMLDSDPAGRMGAVRSLDVLSAHFGTVLVAELPERQDPARLFAANPGLLRAAMHKTRPLLEFAIDSELARWEKVLDHVSGQVGALRAVAPYVVRLPNDRVAAQVVRLANHLGLEERVVSREVLARVSRRPITRASGKEPEAGLDLDSRTP